jgi:hypothetical protein
MLETITVKLNKCTCWCGHSWLSEEVPKRCAGKGKHRDWNARDPQPPKLEPVIDLVASSEPDPFAEVETRKAVGLVRQKQSSGSTIAEELLSRMASKLGRPSHAPNCSCYTCKPPKETK